MEQTSNSIEEMMANCSMTTLYEEDVPLSVFTEWMKAITGGEDTSEKELHPNMQKLVRKMSREDHRVFYSMFELMGIFRSAAPVQVNHRNCIFSLVINEEDVKYMEDYVEQEKAESQPVN